MQPLSSEPANTAQTDASTDATAIIDHAENRGSARVSVVVPVHNAMPHLAACIDSILAQTSPVAEIICIDDGSTDDSGAYLDAVAKSNPRVFVEHRQCAGVSAARNRGMERAKGDYVLFVDADDFIAPDLVEKALRTAAKHEAEMTVFGFDEYYGETDVYVPREICPDEKLYDKAFSLADMELPSPYLITPNVWRILLKKDFIDRCGLAFHEDLRTSEDLAFIYEALFLAKRIALLPDRLYHYRRDGGETLTRKTRGCAGIDALEHVRSFAAQHGVLERNMFHFCNIVLDVAEYATSTAYDLDEFSMLHRSFTDRLLVIVQKNEELIHQRYRPFYDNVLKGEQPYLFFLYRREQQRSEQARAYDAHRVREAEERAEAAERTTRDVEKWARGRIDELEESLAASRAETQEARQEVIDVRASKSYRIGNFFMRGPAAVKRALKGKTE
ncbi:MAG: glycosyltransferase [Slackia sp.]|nr:glycosyltransferase [Slackia sp.]